jgi:hypothetical protein
MARQAKRGGPRLGLPWRGVVAASSGEARQALRGQAWLGLTRPGEAWPGRGVAMPGKAGEARPGEALTWHGMAWPGAARQARLGRHG